MPLDLLVIYLLLTHTCRKEPLQNKGTGLSGYKTVHKERLWDHGLSFSYSDIPNVWRKNHCPSWARAGSMVPYAMGPCLAQPSSCSLGDQLSCIAPAGKRINKLVGLSGDTSPKQQDTLTYRQRYKLLRAPSTLWNGLTAWQE